MASFVGIMLRWGDGWVAIDPGSGGYPYEVQHPRQAKTWVNQDAALEYAAMFKHLAGALPCPVYVEGPPDGP